MKFSKNDTQAVKGLAICMMLFHHLFLAASRFEGFDVDFAPFGEENVVEFAATFKVALSMFVFLSGYGLFLSYNNLAKKGVDGQKSGKWCIVRLFKLMSGFWCIYIICFVWTMLIDRLPIEKYYRGKGLIRGTMYCLFDFFGFSDLLETPTLCGAWWYMSAAVAFILLIPILYHMSQKISWFPILIMAFLLPRMINEGYMGGNNAFTVFPSLILGMMFADYEIFEHIGAKLQDMGKMKAMLLCWAVALMGLVVAYLFWTEFKRAEIWGINCNLIPLIYIFFVKYCLMPLKGINNFLEFLGKKSMTIFMTHSFLRARYLEVWIYSRGHFLMVFLALFVSSLILAILVDAIRHVMGVEKAANKVCEKITANTSNVS
ncbi:MAG: acyltransferase [Lachnospiraceae bacterium]|nr:acyltransferase [Lachnospiraceae bacterium]